MGVNIRTIKPTEYVSGITADYIENCRLIYTLDFLPINHLTKFKEGWYKYEPCGEDRLSMSCSTFNDFRRAVCAPIHGDWDEYTNRIADGTEPCNGAFAEFLFFADNEGAFDYVIAEKLLADFEKYEDSISSTLCHQHKAFYHTYYQILKECVECKGVVYYS